MQNNKILIKNGYIVTDTQTTKGDIFIENHIIAHIAPSIQQNDALIIDAQGQYITPGGIDPHVHLALNTPLGNTCDNFFEGSLAALAGGTTTLIDFVTPERNESLIEALRKRKNEAESSIIDYALHGSITSWHSNTSEEMQEYAEKEGISSFKVYMAYGKTIGISDENLNNTLNAAKKLGLLILSHCEDGNTIDSLRDDAFKKGFHSASYHSLTRPPETETTAVAKLIQMAQAIDTPVYIVHVSAKESLKLIAEAKRKNRLIFAETCPHYLFFTDDVYKIKINPATYIMSPPLRKKADKTLLWKSLQNNTIDVVSTDHCSFSLADKISKNSFINVPNGVAGIETRLGLLFTYGVLPQLFSVNQFVALTSTNPAKLFGLYPQKGTISVGTDADLVIWENKNILIKNQWLHHKSDHSIYQGIKLKIKPQTVIVNGILAYHKGLLYTDKLKGRYLKRGKMMSV